MRILAKGFKGIKKDYSIGKKEPLKIVVIKSMICAAVLAAMVGVISGYVEKSVLTSAGVGSNSCTTVDGRELPIYAVETEKKVVAISFDAAWADYIL